ncbi:unnamed protein product [Auanema sp. JU1783]|nr:unnamed protein product [Auanema sp. JU1783]
MHIRESCVDESEPLRSVLTPDSGGSRRKPDYARRCLLVLLINAIFILAIFLAFLIGQWISDENARRRAENKPLVFDLGSIWTSDSHIILSNNLTNTNRKLVIPNIISDATTSSRGLIREKIIPLQRITKPFSLLDVYPPSSEPYDFLEELHSTHSEEGKDSLLIPLPLHILPTHYNLRLDISKFAFDRLIEANLTITLESFGNATYDEIIFHIGPKIQIQNLKFRGKNGKRVSVKSVKRENNKKIARLLLRERIPNGQYFLEIKYSTKICENSDEDIDGVRCFLDAKETNQTEVLSFTTKFEPALARSFIPSWDEPGIKATFNVSVTHEAKYTVLSNMPPSDSSIRKSEGALPSDIVTTTFLETPPMSIYLLAFAVGIFQPFEMRTDRNIPVTIWTHADDFLSARFAANFSPLIFDKHEEELEVPYPIPKMDFVAARSFPVGGMENWGLVIFDYQSLLLDQVLEEHINMTVDRLYEEYKIEKIITHEISHQWFGNLVTMADWNELWLNEGFATYFVYDLLDEDHPRLTENEYFTKLTRLVRKQSGMEKKALIQNIQTEKQVEKSFHSTHLYAKGSVIVKMIKDLVSDYDFRSGVRRYLRRNAFRAVSRDDLWASLPAYADHGAENERLSDVMESWLVNEGLPVVIITRTYESDTIRVSQQQSREQDFKVFLNSKDMRNSWNHFRAKRSAPQESFDENLFDDIPEKWLDKIKKRKENKKRKKRIRQQFQRNHVKWSNSMVEIHRDDLRKARKVSEPNDLWSIPFSYMFGSMKSTEGQVVRQFWLKNRTLSFTDVELSPSQALLANPEWSYPYRVNYDFTNWKMLARLLHENHHEIPVKSRMQLIVDAETFLLYSELPHLYFYLLSYLSDETDLGVALIGLDAIHRSVDIWRGSSMSNSLLLYITPVINQFDLLLSESQADAELAALWLIEPTRLSKLYQLRCVCNLESCQQDVQAQKWLLYPTSSQEDVHKQVTAVCHFLHINKAEQQIALLEALLKTRGTQWSTAVQLAACARDEKMARLAAKQIVSTRNAAVYALSLQSDFSLHYNMKFRSALWNQIAQLNISERELLFSNDLNLSGPASKILIHSVRTLDELRQVRSLIPEWKGGISKHLEYVELQLQWMDRLSNGILSDFFNGGSML